MEEGKIKRSDIYLATKVNMMGLGTYPCGDRSGPHSYDAEIVMHACKVLPCTLSPQNTCARLPAGPTAVLHLFFVCRRV